MAEYYVLLGDVVHSRDIEDRAAFQEHLADICGRFTAERRDDVYGNFKILKGVDEFGGVLQSLENLYEVVTAFHDGLLPHEVRIAVASGDIDVGLTSFDVEKMDGDAFHRATRRVEELEDESMVFDLLLGEEGGMDGADRSRTGDADLGRAIADEINLLLDLRSEWTDRQREVVAVRESVDTQTAAAEELGVTQQSVSNVLAGAKWPLVHAVEERLRETLGSYSRERGKVREGRTTTGGTLGEWLSTLDWNDVGDEVPAPVRTAVEAALPDDVLESRDGVDVFLDHLQEVAGWDPNADSLQLEVARFLRDHGRPALALEEYEAVLERDPADVAVYLEYAELAVDQDRHQRALSRLVGLFQATAARGAVQELVNDIVGRLDIVIEPMLMNAEDQESVWNALQLLVSFAQRTSGPAGEDIRLWGLVQHARLFGEPHGEAATNESEGSIIDSYCTGLGFLLAEEPEAAVGYFERAWWVLIEDRFRPFDPDRHPDDEVRFAQAAGVALLGCERILGPAILDMPADNLPSTNWQESSALRAPSAWLLTYIHEVVEHEAATAHSEDKAPVEHTAHFHAFPELEARAFETLRDMIEQWADAT